MRTWDVVFYEWIFGESVGITFEQNANSIAIRISKITFKYREQDQSLQLQVSIINGSGGLFSWFGGAYEFLSRAISLCDGLSRPQVLGTVGVLVFFVKLNTPSLEEVEARVVSLGRQIMDLFGYDVASAVLNVWKSSYVECLRQDGKWEEMPYGVYLKDKKYPGVT